MTSLPLRERLFVVTLLFCLIFLFVLSLISDSSAPFSENITLHISGAVEKPGSYQFTEGATLTDLDKKVFMHPEANLKGLKNKLRDLTRGTIVIAEKGYKVVYLSGAVKQSGPVILQEDACVKDLKDTGLLAEEADKKFLKRKRLLKNQEEVIVPGTKSEMK